MLQFITKEVSLLINTPEMKQIPTYYLPVSIDCALIIFVIFYFKVCTDGSVRGIATRLQLKASLDGNPFIVMFPSFKHYGIQHGTLYKKKQFRDVKINHEDYGVLQTYQYG